MSKKYDSEMFQKLYNNFTKMYTNEGNVYESILESIQSDYKHNMIPGELEKKILITILEDATIDFFKKEFKYITEDQFLKTLN